MQSSSANFEWNYFFLIPYNSIRKWFLFSAILAIAIAIIVTFCFYFLSDKVINKINDPVKQILSKLKNAEHSQRETRFQLREDFIYGLLTDSPMTPEKYAELSSKFDISFPFDQKYCLLYLRPAHVQKFIEESGSENCKIILFALTNIVSELASSDFFTECVRLKNNNGIVIICSPKISSGCDIDPIKALYLQIFSQTEKYFPFSLLCAVSEWDTSLAKLPFLFRQVMETMQYFRFEKENSFLTYDIVKKRDEYNYTYDTQKEREMISYIKKGDFQHASEIYLQISNTVTRSSLSSITTTFLQLTLAINTLIDSEKLSDTPFVYKDFSFQPINTINIFDVCDNLTEIDDRYCDIIKLLCDRFKSKLQNKNQIIVDQVNQFIEQQLSDPDLCIDSIAQQIGLSPDYLARIYHQQTNLTVLSAITQKRIQFACTLLAGDSLSIQDISSKSGYRNTSYFYKVFKKNMEMTPAEYRNKCRHFHS